MSDLQAAIDRARDAAISSLFDELVVSLRQRTTEENAAAGFGDGLDAILIAHKIASQAAKDAQIV